MTQQKQVSVLMFTIRYAYLFSKSLLARNGMVRDSRKKYDIKLSQCTVKFRYSERATKFEKKST